MSSPNPPDLTDREREILAHIVDGLTNKEISAKLGTTLKNVEYHLTRLFQKFGVNNRTQLATIVVQSTGAPANGNENAADKSLLLAEQALDQAKSHIQTARGQLSNGAKATTMTLFSIGAFALLWLAVPGARNKETPAASSLPTAQPASAVPAVSPKPKVIESTPDSSIDGAQPIFDQELGVFGPDESPKTWTIGIPANAKRVEATIINLDETQTKEIGLNVMYAGVLQINGKDALRFLRKAKRGAYMVRNAIDQSEFLADETVVNQWLDVTSLIERGSKNSITYQHYTRLPAGVRLRYFE